MPEDILPQFESKSIGKFLLINGAVFAAFFLFYVLYINSADFAYRSIADALIWSIAVMLPVTANIWYVYYKRKLKPYSLVARMLGVYFLTLVIGIVLTISYCNGIECLATIGLLVVISGYNILLNAIFLYLHKSKNKKLYQD